MEHKAGDAVLAALRAREQGCLPTRRSLVASASGSVALLQRLELQRRLEGHSGCVNTVEWSPCGTVLASGSDDMCIKLWDWNLGRQLLSYDSGHRNNVFQARILPHSSNKTVVSCAADGQVRVAHIHEAGGAVQTKLLEQHTGRAHKLALDPVAPASCFFSCGEDGVVYHFDLRQPPVTSLMFRAHASGGQAPMELNSIHCHTGGHQLVLAGSEEAVRVYDIRTLPLDVIGPGTAPVRELAPRHLRAGRRGRLLGTHVTCAVFDGTGNILASYNDENIYLFGREGCRPGAQPAGQRRDEGRQRRGSRRRDRALAGGSSAESAPPTGAHAGRSGYPAAGPSGVVQRHSKRGRSPGGSEAALDAAAASWPRPADGAGPRGEAAEDGPGPRGAQAGPSTLPADAVWLNRLALQPAPGDMRAVASAEEPAGGADAGGGQQPGGSQQGEASGAGISQRDQGQEQSDGMESDDDGSDGGVQVGRPYGAIESDSDAGSGSDDEAAGSVGSAASPDYVLQCFKGHRNAQTVKGVSFFGEDDEYVISGSDCGHIFIWGRGDGQLRMLLKGDSHVVNCLSPHPEHALVLATSGIDDDVKVWAPSRPERQPPGARAEAVMAENLRRQGHPRRQMLITPEMIELLLAGRLGMRLTRGAHGNAGDSGSEGEPMLVDVESSEEEGEDEGEEEEGGGGSGDEQQGTRRRRRRAPADTCSLM